MLPRCKYRCAAHPSRLQYLRIITRELLSGNGGQELDHQAAAARLLPSDAAPEPLCFWQRVECVTVPLDASVLLLDWRVYGVCS